MKTQILYLHFSMPSDNRNLKKSLHFKALSKGIPLEKNRIALSQLVCEQSLKKQIVIEVNMERIWIKMTL